MSDEATYPFGDDWLKPILEAIGETDDQIHGVRLQFITGKFALVTLYRGFGGEWTRPLDAWGVAKVAEALRLPYPAQQVTITVGRDTFGIVLYCALVPRNVPAGAIVDALRASVKPEKEATG